MIKDFAVLVFTFKTWDKISINGTILMNLFFLSLAFIFGGGLLSLIFKRQFALMKAIGTMAIAGGCLLGLIDAGTKLFRPEPYSAVFDYLKAFSLSFKIDALSAFFLVAIYLICLLAALYSYHYMDKEQKAFRTAGSYLFFALLTASMALVVTPAAIDRTRPTPASANPPSTAGTMLGFTAITASASRTGASPTESSG